MLNSLHQLIKVRFMDWPAGGTVTKCQIEHLSVILGKRELNGSITFYTNNTNWS